MKIEELKTPCYLVEEEKLKKNLKVLQYVMEETECHILLAQKAFSMYHSYPLLGEYLSGTTASGLYEAKLGAEEMGKENHVFSGAYREDEFEEIAELCDHIVFNSIGQLLKFQETARAKGKSIGIRINPECSTQEGHAIYEPLCARFPSWNYAGTAGKGGEAGDFGRTGIYRGTGRDCNRKPVSRSGRLAFPYPLRAEFRRFENNLRGSGRKVWFSFKENEMAEYGRRTPHYKKGL